MSPFLNRYFLWQAKKFKFGLLVKRNAFTFSANSVVNNS